MAIAFCGLITRRCDVKEVGGRCGWQGGKGKREGKVKLAILSIYKLFLGPPETTGGPLNVFQPFILKLVVNCKCKAFYRKKLQNTMKTFC